MSRLNDRARTPATVWLRLPDMEPAEGLVREWLSDQLGIAKNDIRFERDAQGRPRLQAPLAHMDCNWSHSGGFLLASVVTHARVGVDIELIQPRRRIDDIAERYFTPAEQAWLGRLNGRNKVRAFHRLWCCKEAILKAHGRGLSFGLDRLELLPDTKRRMQLQAMDAELGSPYAWQLEEWIPAAGYVAALAVKRA
ncbi:4'-phosphopantetheinyl transferase family protein [Lysobacter soyae]|uniref:4'-phosphopantetheinyl transferase superfamily protein n=1 Tax=Lysobacter soyae TaxID=2764185 RepID=A0ABX8WQY9_9GAMM|nr:4'-phosphopantetheinyl transferase superfamily protein [Lysobacter sp. CJ11]QYR53230.1 4'-phosphopantetheinyl transferase superfamily protein [Lysobacter sp. CJ11]